MSLTYRRINHRIELAHVIWQAERRAPRWFGDANRVWCEDYPAFWRFWRSCGEIYGLFDGEELKAVVYLEMLSPDSINIHVSVIGKLREADIVRFFSSLKNKKAIDGVRIMTGWVLNKNTPLLRIAERAGFQQTGLKMSFGSARGKVLKWVQVRG